MYVTSEGMAIVGKAMQSLNASALIADSVFGSETEESFSHCSNPPEMLVMPSGILIEVKEEQPKKVWIKLPVSVEGSSIVWRETHLLKTALSIVVRPSWSDTCLKLGQSEKANSLSLLTPEGISMDSMDVWLNEHPSM
jgi:hypothetical protein